MISVLTGLLLTALQLLTGMGVLGFFRTRIKPGLFLPLCLLFGVSVFSLIPFLLQLLTIPLTSTNIFLALGACVWLNLFSEKNRKENIRLIRRARIRFRPAEIPFLLVISALVLISIWRCYYLPPTPRDLTSGAEVIAEYAVKEKTMINSVFSVNLETTNNQFKPPFITSLQIIYKYAGFPFGQLWLSSVFIGLLVFLYHALNRHLHPLLTGALMIVFLSIPEMYAYTFMALFDYSSAVFFFLSCYFLFEYFRRGRNSYLALSGVLMGIATYIRSETLILSAMMLPLLFWQLWHKKKKVIVSEIAAAAGWFYLPGILFYILSITIYVNGYLPSGYDVQGLVNNDLLNFRPLVSRFAEMNSQLIFSKSGLSYYAYSFLIFGILLLADLIIYRRLNTYSRNWLYAVLVIYLGMPLMGYLLPLLDIDHSTKRGLFRIFPLMCMYMGTSTLLRRMSMHLRRWENPPSKSPKNAEAA